MKQQQLISGFRTSELYITLSKLIVDITNQHIKDDDDGHDYRNSERTITSSRRHITVMVIATPIMSVLSD